MSSLGNPKPTYKTDDLTGKRSYFLGKQKITKKEYDDLKKSQKQEASAIVVSNDAMVGYIKSNGELRSTSFALIETKSSPKYLKVSKRSLGEYLVSPPSPPKSVIAHVTNKTLVSQTFSAKPASRKETESLLDQIRAPRALRPVTQQRKIDKTEVGLKELDSLAQITKRFRTARGSRSSSRSGSSRTFKSARSRSRSSTSTRSSGSVIMSELIGEERSKNELNSQTLEQLEEKLNHKKALLKSLGKFNTQRLNVERDIDKLKTAIDRRKAEAPRKRQRMNEENLEIGDILMRKMKSVTRKSTSRSRSKSSGSRGGEWE